MSDINLNVWPIQDMNIPPIELYPELKFGYVKLTDKSVGIAASGGGSRSHTLCAGYYRAMRELGLTDKAAYISSVSGGTWASSIYTYAKMDDNQLLGVSMKPEDCTLSYLKEHNPGELPVVVTKFFSLVATFMELVKGESLSNLWQRMIGLTLLRPFGLNKKIFGSTEHHKELVMKLNAGNKKLDFAQDLVVLPKPGRPYLIINAALGGPEGYSSGWGASLQFTPLYSGVPFYTEQDYSYHTPTSRLRNIVGIAKDIFNLRPDDYLNDIQEQQFAGNSKLTTKKLITGGGVISTFAFGTDQLKNKEDYYGGLNVVGEIKDQEPFYLEDAVGASSAAFAAALENRTMFHLNPKRSYFPVLQKGSDKFNANSRKFEVPIKRVLADGGNFENTGILPLVQRSVKRIIAFINSPTPIKVTLDQYVDNVFEYNGEPCADTQLLCLFGAVDTITTSYNYTQNQIFATEDLNVIMRALLTQIDAGNGGVVKRKMKIVENTYWNIKGGDEIEFLFIYNAKCNKFIEKLPKETQDELEDNSFFSSFGDFPYYRTSFQDIRPLSLNRSQVNLATAQAEYLLTTANRDLILGMFE